MQIIYLGYAIPEERGINNPAYSAAGNKFELGILDGITNEYTVNAISIPSVAPYPMDKRIFIQREKLTLRNGIETICVSSPNIPIIKQLWQSAMVFREAKRIMKKTKDDILILTYNLYPQVGSAAVKLKRKFGKKIISIIADLPFDDASERNFVSKAVIEMYNSVTRRNLKKGDRYILLNEYAKVFIPETAPFTIIEGGINPEEWQQHENFDGTRKDIIYSGALTDYSGVVQLVEAMQKVKYLNITLRIYGNGYLVDWVKSKAEKSENIEYMGSVPNNEMRALQSKCLLLVNPRPTDTDIARYTFPSKILEYLASGTPVLTSRLNGIPREYDNYLSYIDTVDAMGIAEAIVRFFDGNYETALNRARLGKEFVFSQKNWYSQGKKIISFIKEEEKKGHSIQ